MKILIIRHGEPDYSIDSLTEKGWREAELLSERMAKVEIDDLYVSPLGRAKDTARPTEKATGKKATVLPWLCEFSGRISSPLTSKERIPWDLAPRIWGNEMDFYDLKKWADTPLIKTGNSKEIFEEVKKGVDNLLEKYGVYRVDMLYRTDNKNEPTIALFCHCCMGLCIISHLTGLAPFVLWHNVFLPPSSVTTLVTETDKDGFMHFRSTQIGDTSHLYIAGEPISSAGLYPDFEY